MNHHLSCTSWGVPCVICGWTHWRDIVERYCVIDSTGRPVYRRNGALRRRRLRHPLQFLAEGGWACTHCVERCGLEAQPAATVRL